jgi:hypothetical protein
MEATLSWRHPAKKKKFTTAKTKPFGRPSPRNSWLAFYILLRTLSPQPSSPLFLPTTSPPSSQPVAVDPATSPLQLHQKTKMPPGKRCTWPSRSSRKPEDQEAAAHGVLPRRHMERRGGDCRHRIGPRATLAGRAVIRAGEISKFSLATFVAHRMIPEYLDSLIPYVMTQLLFLYWILS